MGGWDANDTGLQLCFGEEMRKCYLRERWQERDDDEADIIDGVEFTLHFGGCRGIFCGGE